MTLSKKVNWTTALKTGAPHRATRTRRSPHRRAAAAARPAVQTGPIRVERTQLAELRDWGILAGVSLAGWMVAAVAIGLV
jgi:lysozyme family protein